VNAVLPGTVDERVINDKPGDTSRFLRSENIQLALASARGIGCRRVRLRFKGTWERKRPLLRVRAV
jgi:hypothetical protein